jgi:hypothetical protein
VEFIKGKGFSAWNSSREKGFELGILQGCIKRGLRMKFFRAWNSSGVKGFQSLEFVMGEGF